MRFADIRRRLALPSGSEQIDALEITRICSHSAECTTGSIFVCIDGRTDSGQRHLTEAISRGARVIIAPRKHELDNEVYQIISNNTRKCGAEIAKLIYKEVFHALSFIFITGTKGKTTTAHILSHLLCSAGFPTATVGTLGIEFRSYHEATQNTTPDLFRLLAPLKHVYDMGARFCVVEVSSQALADARIDGLSGEYAIFTGLSPDHIDPMEHASFYDYALAKRRLFREFGVKMGFAPRDSEFSTQMLMGVREQYYIDTQKPSELTLKILEMSESGISFCDGERRGFLSVSGEFNLKNAALAVLCASKITGEPCERFYPFLSQIKISGRLESFTVLGREVVIDYAHNAQSVRKIAQLFRSLGKERIVAVIGSVGDRARGRRAELARACEESFDFTVLTEDDTVSESSADIASELHSYFSDPTRATCILPREMAIYEAFRNCVPGDTLLLLGKGHERTIVRRGVREPFDERRILHKIERGEYGKI